MSENGINEFKSEDLTVKIMYKTIVLYELSLEEFKDKLRESSTFMELSNEAGTIRISR